jgi:hypothetical protein
MAKYEALGSEEEEFAAPHWESRLPRTGWCSRSL